MSASQPMGLKQMLQRFPGSMMVLPLFAGTIIHTFFPDVLRMGGFVTAIADGSGALVGAFLFCMGAGIQFSSAPKVAKRGLAITATKFAVGTAIGLVVAQFFNDSLFGLSSLAVIAAMTNSNGGLYSALTSQYGDETDVGAIAILSVNDGPFLTMVALGASGMVDIPTGSLLGVIIPIVAGMIAGNLDARLRTLFTTGGIALIPLFAFSLGSTFDLATLLTAGAPGVLLGLMTLLIGGVFNILADRWSGGTGVAGAAASSTAGNAVATPAALLMIDPSLSIVPEATAQVVASTIITVFLVPVLTGYVYNRSKKVAVANVDEGAATGSERTP